MKANELIEVLQTAQEAEVGFEHIKITNAWVDSPEYIELDGQTARVNYLNNQSGIFIVQTEYVDMPPEVNAVYLTRERAEKFKSWLEKCNTKELNGYGDIKKVTIHNMFIND